MKTRLFAWTISLATCASLSAATVTNWHTFKASPATTLSGQGTGSPMLGSLASSSSTAFLVGYFDALSLTNQGDRITLSYQVSFNDAAGIGSAGDQFRFGLFDINGSTKATADNTGTAGVAGQTDHWLGYRFGIRSSTGTGSTGSIRERSDTGTDINPMANAQSVSIGTPGGDQIAWSGAINGTGGATYTGAMLLEKTPTGVAVAGYYFGNSTTNSYAAVDDTVPSPANYSAVCYLNGSSLSADQILFQNVNVSYSFSNALAFVTQPVSATVNVGQQVIFSSSWTGSGIVPSIQWRENGVDIIGATNATYKIAAASFGQNNNTYSVVVSNVFGNSITSTNATLTVNIDNTPPTVLSVSSLTSNTLNVIFSEPVDTSTAQDSSSYNLSGNSFAGIQQVTSTNVLLLADNPIIANFTLQVQNVKDSSGNTMTTTNVAGIAHRFQDSLGINIGNGFGFAMNDKIEMYAGGLNIFGTSDQFQYTFKTISGDFDLAVKVESLLNTDVNARAGLMARLNIFNDARNVLIEATPGRFIFQYRTNNAEATFTQPSPRPSTAFPNCWVRLVRTGSVITGYSSTNNTSWDLIGSHDTATGTDGAYPTDVLVGMAVSSANTSLITHAVFSNFGKPVITSSLSTVATSTTLQISWDAGAIGLNLQASPTIAPSATWTNIPGSSLTNKVTLPIGAGALFFRLSN